MTDPVSPPAPEELGYFYDTIHGRIAIEDLPLPFRRALKSALSSDSLARLKRISQLGHASLSFFSATHTRFSHAIGTMLVMNKLFNHVRDRGLSPSVFDEVSKHFPTETEAFADVRDMVHCHLLLAALYQDSGELPFQKVSGLHFVPAERDTEVLINRFPGTSPNKWSGKQKFSVFSLLADFNNPELRLGFKGYNLEFLAYLLTTDGGPAGTPEMAALLQMVDGVIDADRLDYVYRDASVTIGSWSRPSTVLQSIVSYAPDCVIVNDSRPVTDFLSTRMRLWTFVYSSADVRFRQALLNTVLDVRWDGDVTDLEFELSHDNFIKLDDISLMEHIRRLNPDRLKPYRRRARELLLRGTLDYESHVLRRSPSHAAEDDAAAHKDLPAEMFFDLLTDHGTHQLYRSRSVFVRHGLLSKLADKLPLEESAGAFSPLFTGTNSAMLVANGYYVFLPREREGGHWQEVKGAIDTNTLFPMVAWEHARRGFPPTDTSRAQGFGDKCISISFCSKDIPTVIRIVRDLHRRKRRYRLFLRPFDGTGGTPTGNSGRLVAEAEAVLAIVSVDYLERARDPGTYLGIEVRAMHDRSRDIPIVVIGVDPRDKLNAVKGFSWAQMNEAWFKDAPVMGPPLKAAGASALIAALDAALSGVNTWRTKV